MADAALIRDLRNTALTFQMRTLEMILRYNPHSPRRNEVTPGERSEPEKDPSPPNLCPYHGSYHPCIWCEKGAPDFNDTRPPGPREPSGNTQGNKGENNA